MIDSFTAVPPIDDEIASTVKRAPRASTGARGRADRTRPRHRRRPKRADTLSNSSPLARPRRLFHQLGEEGISLEVGSDGDRAGVRTDGRLRLFLFTSSDQNLNGERGLPGEAPQPHLERGQQAVRVERARPGAVQAKRDLAGRTPPPASTGARATRGSAGAGAAPCSAQKARAAVASSSVEASSSLAHAVKSAYCSGASGSCAPRPAYTSIASATRFAQEVSVANHSIQRERQEMALLFEAKERGMKQRTLLLIDGREASSASTAAMRSACLASC